MVSTSTPDVDRLPRGAALAAFQKLLDQHPSSEYVEDARKEINYLGGP